MTQPKVFEFAKEMGIETLSLMDKLRQWDIPVKNHMTELDEETLKSIRSHLLSEQKKVKTQKKKRVSKKTTTSKKQVKTIQKSTAQKKVVKKKVIRRKASDLPSAKQTYARAQKQLEKDALELESQQKAQLGEEQIAAKEGTKKPDAKSLNQTLETPSNQEKKTYDTKITGKAIIGEIDLSQATKPRSTPYNGPEKLNSQIGLSPHKDREVSKKHLPTLKELKTTKINIQKEESSSLFLGSEFRKREVIFQPKKKNLILNREIKKTRITTPAAHKRVVKLYGHITVTDFAQQMQIKSSQLVATLTKNGVQANINSVLDHETASLIASEFQYETENIERLLEDLIADARFGDTTTAKVPRTPIVTVMGHIDHGKTTLLDTIRKTNVVSGEAGSITQHIGAYSVHLDDKNSKDRNGITFIDTPGHEAFTAMRARGANVTDIAVIVIAADDGIMPQTIEAINHAKAAKTPIIVAVSKMDKPEADIEKIRQEATKFDLVSEEWGGSTIFIPISAPKGEGIPDLLETILLVSEMQDIKANPKQSGTGIVIEAEVKKEKGPVSTLLIQDGSVSVGQYIVAGKIGGRIKAMLNDRGQKITTAAPGTPIEVLGLEGCPNAGDRFDICKTESYVSEIIKKRKDMEIITSITPGSQMSLEDLFSKVKKEQVSTLSLVIKTDVRGTGEAIEKSINSMLDKMPTKEVNLKIIHQAVGGINESDILLASAANGMVVGFNVRPDNGALQLAKSEKVQIKTYKIIYDLIQDIENAMKGLLKPTFEEQITGHLEVRNTFSVSKIGTIAGCFLTSGKIQRKSDVRLLRDGVVIYEGKINSLKRFKEDTKEVTSGFECGLSIEKFNDIKVGDTIEVFKIVEVPKTI